MDLVQPVLKQEPIPLQKGSKTNVVHPIPLPGAPRQRGAFWHLLGPVLTHLGLQWVHWPCGWRGDAAQAGDKIRTQRLDPPNPEMWAKSPQEWIARSRWPLMQVSWACCPSSCCTPSPLSRRRQPGPWAIWHPQHLQQLIACNILSPLVALLKNGDFKAQKEAVWTVVHFRTGGTMDQLMQLVHSEVLELLVNLITIPDTKLLSLSLTSSLFYSRWQRSSLRRNPCVFWSRNLVGLIASRLCNFMRTIPDCSEHYREPLFWGGRKWHNITIPGPSSWILKALNIKILKLCNF